MRPTGGQRRNLCGMDEKEARHLISLNDAELEQLPGLAWDRLKDGAARGRDPFHTPVLASVHDGVPQARTVVLRAANPDARELVCHTDQRSPKIAALGQSGDIAWVFYDPGAKLQLRLRGPGVLHHQDDFAAERWAASRPGSRLCYQNPFAPGTGIDVPESALPDAELEGYSHFTAIRCTVEAFDWLYLDARGHRRAGFQWWDDSWQGRWLAP